ncbi:MAG: DnaB-like helicase N-terminal domain-containing protein, partial [Candidatus Kapaibacterium sp.]
MDARMQNIPPHSVEAEINVLGSMMVDRGAIAKTIEILDFDSFYSEANTTIYAAICALFESGTPVDIITLSQELRRQGQLERIGGTYYLTEINAQTPTSFAVEHHARIVQEHYLKRRLIQAAGTMIESCYDETTDALEEIDRAEQEIFDIAEKRLRKT